MGMSVDAESSLSSRGSLPECRTPLSVLCVSTNDMEHRLYLHGRYPLLTLPKCNNGIINTTSSASSMKSPLVVASNDLVRTQHVSFPSPVKIQNFFAHNKIIKPLSYFFTL